MKRISYILGSMLLLAAMPSFAQVKHNVKTEKVKISGNCGMCKRTIEKAGNVKDLAKVDWDTQSKVATLSYDSVKTNKSEILNRIALAGYDNEGFTAPDQTYKSLHGCCQYDRPEKKKPIAK